MGKSTLISHMFKSLHERGKSAWFVIHREELRDQVEKILQKASVPYGLIVAGGKYDPDKPIQICMAQTLVNRIGLMKKPDLVFFDEAHISCSRTYKKILSFLPDAFIIGGTATPRRTDRKPLKEIYDYMVMSEDTRWLIDNGYLAKYKIYRPSSINLTKVKISRGDYDQKELSETLDRSSITGDALEHYERLAKGKKFVVFDYSVKASKDTADLFTQAGYPCAHVDADTPKAQRRETLEKFRKNELMGLSNYSLFTEGLDIPDIDCVILKRPTKSIIVYRQSVGRGLRKTTPDKVLIILDHAGASIEHGLPCEAVGWSLEGSKKAKFDKVAATKTCPKCFVVTTPNAANCPECGHAFHTTERKLVHNDGQLEEVNIEDLRKKRQELEAKAVTLQDFYNLAKQLNYKKGWGYYAWKRKQERSRGAIGSKQGV